VPLVITGEAVWQGTVELPEDVLITESARLVIAPGTTVIVRASEGTRTDPQFYSTETEILVRGKLEVNGSAEAPVSFRAAPGGTPWAGIVADGPGASVSLVRATVSGARPGSPSSAGGVPRRRDVHRLPLRVVLLGAATARLTRCRLEGNDYGLADYSGGAALQETTVAGNRERDRLDRSSLAGWREPEWWRLPYRHRPASGETEYLGDQAINGDTTWSGRIVIRGQVAVQAGATLTLEPGTEVAFRKLDTNGDGLGESQLLVLACCGCWGRRTTGPLHLRRAGAPPGGLGQGQPDLQRVAAERGGQRPLRVRLPGVPQPLLHRAPRVGDLRRQLPRRAVPGVAGTSVAGAWFTRNKSAMRFRDSQVSLSDILLEGNTTGINYLRCTVSLTDSAITGTFADPLLGRESQSTVTGVIIDANREGPRFKGEGSRLQMSGARCTATSRTGSRWPTRRRPSTGSTSRATASTASR